MVRVVNRLQSDLHAVCPGLLAITGEADNLWFLNFLTCRDKLSKLSKLRQSGLLAIRGVGKLYASRIRAWQPQAQFAPEIEWVGEMIRQDARRILALGANIKAMDQKAPPTRENALVSHCADSLRNVVGALRRARR